MKKDVLQNRTSNYRVTMPIFLAALLSVIGYLFVNAGELSIAQIIWISFGIVAILACLGILVWSNEKNLKELEKL